MSQLKKGLICGGTCMAVVVFLLCFVFLVPSGKDGKKEDDKQQEQIGSDTAEDGKSMKFSAAAYQVPANQDTDMTQYLDTEGMDSEDIEWSADSDNVTVGSQGHLVIENYGVNTTLTAASKSDSSLQATCQVSTRTEEDDLEYQVKSLNEIQDNTASGSAVSVNNTEDNTGISFQTMTYSPAKRNKSYKWDKSLFYSLEDVYVDSDKDGKINSYDVTRKKFTNLDSGNEMEYEIYENPTTNKINKIISIEYLKNKLEITSYYYTDDGKVNFIFKKRDTNYVPDYASPDNNGERYYFKKDVMVNWRIVDNSASKKIVSYCVGKKEYDRLKKAGTDNKITMYDKCSKKRKKSFDKKEKEMLNKAYITYQKVTASEGISTIYGYVYDVTNQPMENVEVSLNTDDFEKELGTFQTNSEGQYAIQVPNRKKSYCLSYVKDGFKEQKMYGVTMDTTQTNVYGETVYMPETSEETFSNTLRFYDAATQYSSTQMMSLNSGDVNIREGINNRDGDILLTAHFSDGYTNVDLAPGMYTVEVNSDNYTRTYCNIFANPELSENVHEIYVSGELRSDEMRIVLTWGASPSDLDSHLFLPYDGSAGSEATGDAYHISYYSKQIADGSAMLDVDDTDGYGPETTTIYKMKNGYYKFYVTDFHACCQGDYKSTEMSQSSATVRVYGKNGLVQSFYVPANRKGVIWEVFEIRNGVVVPVQRYYDNVDGKTWYRSDK